MGGGARGNPARRGADDAELRQIDALNRLHSDPSAREELVPDPPGPAEDGGPAADPPDAPDPIGADLEETAEPPEAADAADAADAPDARTASGEAPAAPADSAAASPRHRDALLVDTGHTVADAQSLEEALKALNALRTPDFPLDGQAVFGINGGFLSKLATNGFRAAGPERIFRMPLSTGYPATEVVRTGRPVFLATAEEYRTRFPVTYPLTAHKGRRSWAFLPLTAGGRLNGVWLAAFRTQVAFTEDERTLLTVTARLVAQALERTRVGEAEIALSRGLRSSMGRAGAAIKGLSVATRYVPTGGGLMVGGDWFDSIDLPSGRLALVIGDVQGHDVHAASLMTQLRTAVHAYASEGHGPDAVLARASRFLTELDEDRFATCVYIEADPETGLLQLARAGHPHPVMRLPDGTCMIKHIPGGLPLGLMPGGEDYPVTLMQLHEQEVLMLCTDGLIETGGYDMYSGWVRVRDAMAPGPGDDLERMADRLVEAVNGPPPSAGRTRPEPDLRRADVRARNEDDIALLLVRRDAGERRPDLSERRLVLAIEQGRGEDLSEARAELESLLHDWARSEQVDTAVLLASELAGNVLMHTDQSAALVAVVAGECGRRVLTVEVTDRGDELPHQRAPGELASSGRGLVLLDLLADAWGVRPEAEGKTVWFSLREDTAADGG
jgi:serine phosphatase RsbU (regulator of sigma subunit)/anti-sigma regulatory factor (Ser/Thr protein kinase)